MALPPFAHHMKRARLHRAVRLPSLGNVCGAVAVCLLTTGSALAGPWAESGDAALRSDMEILAAAGAIDNVTMSWPLPWAGILRSLDQSDALDGVPDYVRDAAQRVHSRGQAETQSTRLRASLITDLTGAPSTVRGFDALGRETVQGQGILDYSSGGSTIHLALGAQSVNRTDRQVFLPDGSYVAQRIGNAAVYAGYVTHWWGPGWISAMSLSNNARPVPQIGISRFDTHAFKTPWLSWLGPWQMEFFVGVLDGPRLARNTIYDGFRFGFSPLPHLEIGFSRTDEMCGTGHPCKPLTGYFNINNQNNGANIVNDEGTIDIRYSNRFGRWSYSVYTQVMNEDTNPFVHSGTSHLVGGTLWAPIGAALGRVTVEYTDSRPTLDIWGSGIMHGFAYNNWQYADGMHYRGRTLGFSLDSDSRLFSVQASYSDQAARSFTLTYHRADISNTLNPFGNVVTTSPVSMNIVQGRISIPFAWGEGKVRLEIEGRLQDDQPRPDKGFLATGEMALSFSL